MSLRADAWQSSLSSLSFWGSCHSCEGRNPGPRSFFFLVIASGRVAIQFFFFVILDPESRTQVIVLPCHCERMRGNPVDALLLQTQIYWIAAVVTLPRNDKSFLISFIPNIFPCFSFVIPAKAGIGTIQCEQREPIHICS